MSIEDLWEEASQSGERVALGALVVCDWCGKDYTQNKECGGFIFCSYATCPDCADNQMKKIKGYGEEHLIRAVCPQDKSFADFVREYRGEDAAISISSLDV